MEQSKFYQIKNITEQEYTLVGCDGSVIIRSIQDVNRLASVFTIQNAKDGDVLANENGSPFIFNGFLGKTTVGTHCGITSGIFCIPREKTIWASRNVLPATKEQCDLLFSKMKEAGYEWSDKDRKLIKME